MSQLDDDLAVLTAAVAKSTTVTQSVLTFASGIPALIQAAVDKALAAGATADELKSVTDAATAISNNADAIAAAVVANTPPAPTT